MEDTDLRHSIALTVFKPVDTASIPLLRHFFEKYPSRSCDFSIGGVLMWAEYFDYRYAIVDDSLYLTGHAQGTDSMLFYAPRGPLPESEYKEAISDYCRRNCIDGIYICNAEVQPDDEAKSSIETPSVNEWREYLYDIDRFDGFPGRKMEKKRNHLNYFRNHNANVEITEITTDNIDSLIDFTRLFDAMHDADPLLKYENDATIQTLKDYGLYPYHGLSIEIDGQVAGYTFGEKTGDTFFVHVEKGNISFRGIYQALASSMARYVKEHWPEVKYLNREEDMGIDDLRTSKLSYHPSLFVEKHLMRI